MPSSKRLTKKQKLQKKWDDKLHNAGLGMGRGASNMSYGHDYGLGDSEKEVFGGKKTPKRPSLSEIEKDG